MFASKYYILNLRANVALPDQVYSPSIVFCLTML